MTTVAIHSVPGQQGGLSYHAVAGDKRSVGRTAGEALDALTAQLSDQDTGTMVIVQHSRPDRFFPSQKVERLEALMAKWRAARDKGESLTTTLQSELDALVTEELEAAGHRAAAIDSLDPK